MDSEQKTINTAERKVYRPASSKRGLGWPWNNTASEFSLYQDAIKAGKIGWLFNWEMWKPEGLPTELEYVPQVRLGNQAAQIDQFLSNVHPSHFFGFNEPDMASESNMDVSTAVSLWHQYVLPAKAKFNFRLGSPAMTSDPKGKAWLSSFFAEIDHSTIDFVVVHWYGTSASQLESFLDDMHTTFKKPLWLTEFAYSHFGAEPAPTSEQVEGFLREAVPMLDRDGRVERYAYFGAPTDVGAWVGEANNFSVQGKELTPVGRLYLEL